MVFLKKVKLILILLSVVFCFTFCIGESVFAVASIESEDGSKDAWVSGHVNSYATALKANLISDKLDNGGPFYIIGRLISAGLSALSVALLIFAAYGGFLWMTSFGNEEKLKKGKQVIIHALIGMIITLFAFSITYYVTSRIQNPTEEVQFKQELKN